MSAMADVDILLTESAAAGEAAGVRMAVARAALVARYGYLASDPAWLELTGAMDDAYDAAVDFPIEVRNLFTVGRADPCKVEDVHGNHVPTRDESETPDVTNPTNDDTRAALDGIHARALDAIQRVMSGSEWSPDTLDIIAGIVASTGRPIAGYEDTERDPRA